LTTLIQLDASCDWPLTVLVASNSSVAEPVPALASCSAFRFQPVRSIEVALPVLVTVWAA
jgi:hypothetical protein